MIAPKIYSHKYESGLTSQIVLRPNFNQRFFGIIVDFGSADPQEKPGSAHFLEHKLFAKPEGDLSHQFEKLGADVNAMTSFNETMFYCSGIDQNNKLIELLFRLVGEPYFTKENVAKETPIIQQELAMYQDDPSWAIGNNLMIEMFDQSNLGIDVAGTKESIAAITAEDLTQVYQENYLPEKMHFIACGDFSEGQIQSITSLVDRLQKKYLDSSKKAKFSDLQEHGKMRDLVIDSTTDSNMFGLGLRLQNFKKVLSSWELAQILLEIMLESKLSVMSPWFEQMKQAGLVTNSLQISANYTRQGNFVTILGLSPKSPILIDQIKKEIVKPISSKDLVYAKMFFEMQKKEWLAQHERSLNNIPFLAIEMAEGSLDNEDSYANLRNLQAMSFEDYQKFCQSLLEGCEICSVSLRKGK